MNPGAKVAVGRAADIVTVHIWRHPRVRGADGRCVGHTDLALDRRKAKRLAHRIRAFARQHGLPREIVTSPLQRCANVGRVLASWGWIHSIEPLLIEVNFGLWDGRAWSDISRAEVDQWCADLLNNRPGGGEAVAELLRRVSSWRPGTARLAVGHGGWLSAALWLGQHGLWPLLQQWRPVTGQQRLRRAAGSWSDSPQAGTVQRGETVQSSGDAQVSNPRVRTTPAATVDALMVGPLFPA